MLATIISGAVSGIDGFMVEVEIDLSQGMPFFHIVGLPDAAVKESKERVKAAVKNSGYAFPANNRVTVNLAPADVRKEGASFDLPIAIGLLAALQIIPHGLLSQYMIIGELSLDGRVKAVPGVLSVTAEAARKRLKGIIVPVPNAREAAVVQGIDVLPVDYLSEAVEFLRGERGIEPLKIDPEEVFNRGMEYHEDFSDVKGQEQAKRALEVAAAGGHNVLMIGPPGAGKTMLAKRLPTILPGMTFGEALETTRIYSVLGKVSPDEPLQVHRPFRSPHHTISDAGLIGGGTMPQPGEISMAHHGVLFLDELPEFKKHVLEVMRQPLEEGTVTISRASASLTFPARMMLVAAMNPCPCGYLGDRNHRCDCTPRQISAYRSRLSGPLLDRIDIHIEVPAVRYRELSDETRGEPSERVRARVIKARQIQARRFSGKNIYTNASMSSRMLQKHCQVDEAGHELMERCVDRLGMSARAHARILKVARTIADLEGEEHVSIAHLSEAVQYRSLDRALQ